MAIDVDNLQVRACFMQPRRDEKSESSSDFQESGVRCTAYKFTVLLAEWSSSPVARQIFFTIGLRTALA